MIYRDFDPDQFEKVMLALTAIAALLLGAAIPAMLALRAG